MKWRREAGLCGKGRESPVARDRKQESYGRAHRGPGAPDIGWSCGFLSQDLWPARLLKARDGRFGVHCQARQWGHLLQKEQGGEEASVAKLLVTLKDQRTHTEQPLRLSAVNSLTAAVLAGHRGALAAQAEALMDRRKVVRRSALEGLGQAASQPELGVPAQLSQVMPPPDARYQVESRRAAADALSLLGPKGSDQLLPMVRDWLQDEDAEVRASAAKATGVMSSTVADVERIAPLLQDKNWSGGPVRELFQVDSGHFSGPRRVSEASIEALESISGGLGEVCWVSSAARHCETPVQAGQHEGV